MSSQQSRWLYLPIILIFIYVLSSLEFRAHRALHLGLLLALSINALSIFRSNQLSMSQWRHVPLRAWDQFLLDQTRGKPIREEITVTNKEIAFAESPVRVTGRDHFYILDTPPRS